MQFKEWKTIISIDISTGLFTEKLVHENSILKILLIDNNSHIYECRVDDPISYRVMDEELVLEYNRTSSKNGSWTYIEDNENPTNYIICTWDLCFKINTEKPPKIKKI